jgi:hypothetical protein
LDSPVKHRHTFVDTYDGMVAFGFSRETDEKSLIYYLQKFSDDDLMNLLVPRMSDEEINTLFELIGSTMRKHMVEEEYHQYFLKDEHPHSHDLH